MGLATYPGAMRRLLLVSSCVAVLCMAAAVALPGAAQAVCGCRSFAVGFTHHHEVRKSFDRKLRGDGIDVVTRSRIKRGIYDWARDGYTDPSFCNRSPAHRKACKAAIACVVAAGPTYLAARARGESTKSAVSGAVSGCVTGVLTVYLVA